METKFEIRIVFPLNKPYIFVQKKKKRKEKQKKKM